VAQPIEVTGAPFNRSVIWENMKYSPTDRIVRSVASLSACLAILVVACAVLVSASIAKQALLSNDTIVSCDAMDSIRNATGLQFRDSNSGSFDPALQEAWPFAEAYALEHYGSSFPLLDPLSRNESLKECYCARDVPWYNMTNTELQSNPDRLLCLAQYCPSMAFRSPFAIYQVEACSHWTGRWLSTIFITVGVSLVLVGLNAAIAATLRETTKLEGHPTVDLLEFAYGWKSFLGQFVNVAVLPVLVSASLPGMSHTSTILQQFGDFSRDWYANVGV